MRARVEGRWTGARPEIPGGRHRPPTVHLEEIDGEGRCRYSPRLRAPRSAQRHREPEGVSEGLSSLRDRRPDPSSACQGIRKLSPLCPALKKPSTCTAPPPPLSLQEVGCGQHACRTSELTEPGRRRRAAPPGRRARKRGASQPLQRFSPRLKPGFAAFPRHVLRQTPRGRGQPIREERGKPGCTGVAYVMDGPPSTRPTSLSFCGLSLGRPAVTGSATVSSCV